MGSRIKQNPETTFEVYVEVAYPRTGGTLSDPEVQRQFPEDYSDQEVLQTLTKFCFPFYVDSLTVSQVGQNFTFVLTDIDSKQRFGFCRLSSGAKSCFCILSYLPWFEVFYKLLNILADYTTKGQENQWNELLETLHKLPIPDPGVSVHLSMHSYFTVPDTRELPSIPENRNLTEYFVAVDVNNMLHLYASMLYERRILIVCSKLSTLTACIHGSAAMLYPMFWQHVYIPVLPPHLLDYCCAPMPYLIGIHLSLMEKVRNMALDDVVILNVDTNTLETPFDDLQSLPNDVISSLKNRLKKVSTTTGNGVARAFLKAQAAFFGSYRNALKIEPEEPITFCEEAFVSHYRSGAMRQFLQNATQLQLFKQFIDGRLDLLNSGKGFSDVFEEEISMGEYAGSDKLYHQWLSTVRKGSGAILNTVKTKANPAMKTVYKFAKDHAKMGIKEVKNRLKQKDITENGCAPTMEDQLPKTMPSPLVDAKDPKLREDRRPITVHFGQVRPPRPHVMKKPKSNITGEGQRTSVSSPEQPAAPSHQRGQALDLTGLRTTAAWFEEAKVQSSTKALCSCVSPDVPGRFRGVQLLYRVVISASSSKPEEKSMLPAGVSEGRSRWIQGTPKSFVQFDASRGARPPHARLPPARLTGKRGPWPGIPGCRFLARAYGHISLPHGDSRGSASTGLLTTSTSWSGVWMDGRMDGLMTVSFSVKSVQGSLQLGFWEGWKSPV
ncbi:DENN domain-containing protein 1A isoform X7 [Ailuropoda melanoleuca]|uniref:DENN domain-containing protein 1A isoform X7 n=1 Tax=Ailuropoda melanoleuca TaxID=9646 RepID=UPI001494D254|nr:DENN domain-containing protein 1A isoform X7 [Ailuropoda melanoleuca]